MVLLALTLCFAESYNGFEVKKGYGDVDVIIMELSEDFSNKNSGKITFEIPLSYYKAMESQLGTVDEYMSVSDEDLRSAEMDDFNDALDTISKIMQIKGGMDEKSMQECQNWATALESAKTQQSKNYKNIFGVFVSSLKGSISNISKIINMVCSNGMTTKELAGQIKNNKTAINQFYMLLEAFPNIKLSNLGF